MTICDVDSPAEGRSLADHGCGQPGKSHSRTYNAIALRHCESQVIYFVPLF